MMNPLPHPPDHTGPIPAVKGLGLSTQMTSLTVPPGYTPSPPDHAGPIPAFIGLVNKRIL